MYFLYDIYNIYINKNNIKTDNDQRLCHYFDKSPFGLVYGHSRENCTCVPLTSFLWKKFKFFFSHTYCLVCKDVS